MHKYDIFHCQVHKLEHELAGGRGEGGIGTLGWGWCLAVVVQYLNGSLEVQLKHRIITAAG